MEVQESHGDLGTECQMENGSGLGPQVTLRGREQLWENGTEKLCRGVQGSVAV